MQLRLRKVVGVVQVRVDHVLFLFPGLFVHPAPVYLPVFDGVFRVDQVGDVPLHRRPVYLQAVFALQLLRNLGLGHGMIPVGIIPQDLQDIQDNDLLPAFRRQCHCASSPPSSSSARACSSSLSFTPASRAFRIHSFAAASSFTVPLPV